MQVLNFIDFYSISIRCTCKVYDNKLNEYGRDIYHIVLFGFAVYGCFVTLTFGVNFYSCNLNSDMKHFNRIEYKSTSFDSLGVELGWIVTIFLYKLAPQLCINCPHCIEER